jgi:hypothetical protein
MRLLGVNVGLNPATLALGAGVLILGPTILGIGKSLARSVVKTGIKGSLMLYEKGKETLSEAKETVEDLTAEARSEVSETKKAQPAKKASSA